MVLTALYLAHLNPVTRAHIEIIEYLKHEADRVKVMPVVFRDGDREINSKSFPFSFEVRRNMLRSAVNGGIDITDDYRFVTPFKRYMPPLLSRMSWKLRASVLRGVDGDFFSYTGDRAEGLMLRLYRLRPRVGRRRAISAASVKAHMYGEAAGGSDSWSGSVPQGVADIIRSEWDTVQHYAGMSDDSVRIVGMKFPREGW